MLSHDTGEIASTASADADAGRLPAAPSRLSPGGRAEQSLILPPGGLVLDRGASSGNGCIRRPTLQPRVSLLMRRSGSGWNTPEDIMLEKARVALADERPILNQDLTNRRHCENSTIPWPALSAVTFC